MRLLFSTTLLLCLALAICCAPQENFLYPSAKAQTIPQPTPSWTLDANKMNIAVLTVDYSTNALQHAYFMQEPSCLQPLSTQTIITQARAALSNTATGDLIDTTLQANGLLAESVDWADEFMNWEVHLGDFTANALLSPCTGNVVFASESIWTGYGERPYPRNPLPAQSLVHLAETSPPPLALTPLEASQLITDTLPDAWAAIADLNLVHDLSQTPYSALAFLYRPATGYVDPLEELEEAQWIFVLYTEARPQAQGEFKIYLSLIRQ